MHMSAQGAPAASDTRPSLAPALIHAPSVSRTCSPAHALSSSCSRLSRFQPYHTASSLYLTASYSSSRPFALPPPAAVLSTSSPSPTARLLEQGDRSVSATRAPGVHERVEADCAALPSRESRAASPVRRVPPGRSRLMPSLLALTVGLSCSQLPMSAAASLGVSPLPIDAHTSIPRLPDAALLVPRQVAASASGAGNDADTSTTAGAAQASQASTQANAATTASAGTSQATSAATQQTSTPDASPTTSASPLPSTSDAASPTSTQAESPSSTPTSSTQPPPSSTEQPTTSDADATTSAIPTTSTPDPQRAQRPRRVQSRRPAHQISQRPPLT
ncbi:uncharacterized protein LAESUDRAFT_425016 [Laetiporus sulphureus 93-53]|uniref:Uncharacterized protein n=1 Tax=Laetiporus sulphureus 93-53 TaxID=1314785 RepID=A0A165GJ17_9APHY|nr:uncharacterized protein LAESUDRAFT_425016 [Laetiporus sulphureus 93-53]KZT10418.1 hypothetical protein LAESUDRAFT_425016 [Laetiporus sulphureus 93-53]